MTLVNTSALRPPPTTPPPEEFLDVLTGPMRRSIDRGRVTLDGRDSGLSARNDRPTLAASTDRAVTRDELFASVWAHAEECPTPYRGYPA